MQTYISILRTSLAIAGGWFAIVLWFLLLTVKKSPLNQLIENLGIIPLLTHSNIEGMISWYHLSIILQAVLVFASGGFLTAYIAKDHELTASSILSFFAVLTCIIWNIYFDSRVYRVIDIFIWFNSILIIMLSGLIVVRARLIKYIIRRIIMRKN